MKRKIIVTAGVFLGLAILSGGAPPSSSALTRQQVLDTARESGIPDFNGTPNYANSPIMRKFVDGLPGLCGEYPTAFNAAGEITATATLNQVNNLGQCLTIAEPDQATYPGTDYYEIELVQYREQVHSDLPPLVGGTGTAATAGGTLMRGYRQLGVTGPSAEPHHLGPIIIAQKDRPVRIKYVNSLPTGEDGKLFIPVDTSVMGAGPGPNHDRRGDPRTESEVCEDNPELCFTQNRSTVHLHGGRTPWISDGTAHQWITPAGETTAYPKGASVAYVPDMWFDNLGQTIASCAGKTICNVPGASNNPGDGMQTYYYTNNQSARLMFYHDHAWGITRLNVYVGEVAGYLVTDETENNLINSGLIPDAFHTIPLLIQDRTFVDADTIVDMVERDAAGNEISRALNAGTDPTWIWGSQPGLGIYGGNQWATGAVPTTGDLWWPHVYSPAQNPYNPDMTGIAPFGRWHYGPWFWPPTDVPFGPIPNPYYDGPGGEQALAGQPPEIPGTPNPSWGAEAFLDTPVVNGTAYPTLEVQPQKYRFRILNGAHDRFWNLQLYVADSTVPVPADCAGTGCVADTEVAMVQASPNAAYPPLWPADNREGGVPDPAFRGPAMVQIANEGGFLPKPVMLPNQPVNWNVDVTTFTAGLVLQQNEGGGTLMLGPAERADVIIDFADFAGKTLILYNDAPAPWPSVDPHYDYYTGNPDNREIGGADTTMVGRGPNTRTIMQIKVAGSGGAATPDYYDTANFNNLVTAFQGLDGVFATGQEDIVVGQSAYNANYETTFPATWPYWGLSRITDSELSWMEVDGALVNNYPMEPKAIQDEMGEVFDEFGRMSAKLGLEMAKTTAGIQTFILQNFVDPPTEIVSKDQVQIWKITQNGVDTHPVHFHMFEVQVLNRVGWDGFMYLPDPNEIGWKDTVRISPLQDTIVALRPAKVPTPFTVPNSIRPLNPAYPLGVEAMFTNLDPKTGEALTEPLVNQMFNFGHEYLWHCHILSHEEQDMMRPIVLNANQIVYTDNGTSGFWQWNRGNWDQISTSDPTDIVASGTYAYATTADGLHQWNGYTWSKIHGLNPSRMVAQGPLLYSVFPGYGGLYEWNGASWSKISSATPAQFKVSEFGLFATFTGYGLYTWTGSGWVKVHSVAPVNITVADHALYAFFNGYGLYKYDGSSWLKIHSLNPGMIEVSGNNVFASFAPYGLYQYDGSSWTKLHSLIPLEFKASKSTLYAQFPTFGLYQLMGTVWNRISPDLPSKMDPSGSILYATFPGTGAQKWEFNAWTMLAGAPPTLPENIDGGF